MAKSIYYTILASPWSPLFLAGTEESVCSCEFIKGKDISSLLSRVQKLNPHALIKEDPQPLASAVDCLNRYFAGEPENLDQPLDLQGTHFQMQVWSTLRQIPAGKVATYGNIAARIGRPRGTRAVGQACGRNPVVLFIPCHRVVAAHGGLGGFGSGLSLKEALLRHEGVFSFQRSAVRDDHYSDVIESAKS
jgi:O-6-methylguanine DNA methyltransferase